MAFYNDERVQYRKIMRVQWSNVYDRFKGWMKTFKPGDELRPIKPRPRGRAVLVARQRKARS